MTDIVLTARDLFADRHGLRNASSTNGLVAAKLHRVRQAIDTLVEPSLLAFDDVHRAHAKQKDGNPIILPGKAYIPTFTQAYDIDPERATALNEALAPILAESLSLSVTLFTEADTGWITTSADSEAERAAFGAALARYTATA